MNEPTMETLTRRLDKVERENRRLKQVGVVALTLAVLVSLGVVGPVEGAHKSDRQSLVGLPGVYVLVEETHPDVKRDGLTKTTLRTDVELHLRQGGIRIMTKEESFSAPGAPYLYLNINTVKFKDEPGWYAYSIDLELTQGVRLDRKPSIPLNAITWNARGSVGVVGARQLRTVRQYVRDMVDQFINDYLAANPKKERLPPQYIPPHR